MAPRSPDRGALVPLAGNALSAAAVLLLSAPLARGQAYYYNSNDCNSACALATMGGYQTCLNACYACFSYYNYCYATFISYISGNVYTGSNCYCSSSYYVWAWWAWLLLALGISVTCGLMVYCIYLGASKKRRAQEEQQVAMAAAAQPAYPAGAYGEPPKDAGYPGAYPPPPPPASYPPPV